MVDHRLIFLALTFFALRPAESANILVTVMGVSGSQNLVMYRLAELMGQRGHNVTVLKAEIFPEAKAIKLKHAKEVRYSVVADEETLDELRTTLLMGTWNQSAHTMVPIGAVIKIFRQIRLSCEALLDRQDFIQSLNDSHFDVVVIHFIDFCTFGLTKILGIDAYVWMSTAFLIEPMAWYSGAPLAHSYVPNVVVPSDPSGHLSFLERFQNTIVSCLMLGFFQYGVVGPYTEVFRNRYGPDFPHYGDILRKTQLYFSNSDPLFEYARPTPENVINVGGLTMKKAEPLNEEWQKMMDNAPKEGVVVFSLGSVVNTSAMPQELRLAFLNAFKRFPHLFIWRFEGAFPEAKSAKNVHLSTWLPQKDLMAHPNVKAAIIHGGYNSLTETTYLGVPVVVFPMFGDQYGNAARVTRQNIGVRLDRDGINEDRVYEALSKVLYDQKIQESAKRLGQMIKERPFSSFQQAVEWLEYLAKFKRLDQLQPQSHALYLFQYLLLDIFLLFLGIATVIFAVTAFCVRVCVRMCKKRVADKDKEKRKGNKDKKKNKRE